MNRKDYIDDISSVVASKEVIDSLDLFLLLLVMRVLLVPLVNISC